MFQQPVSNLSAIRSLVAVAVCTILLAFSYRVGGDSVSICLNDKVLMLEHVMSESTVKNLSLRVGNVNDVLRIHYSHCGKTGMERSVSIQDGQNNVLKTWIFTDRPPP